MKTRRFKVLVAALSLTTLMHGLPAFGMNYVIPTNNTVVAGDASQAFPCLSSQCKRYQQVFSASEFGSAQNPQMITRLGFRYRTTTSTFYLSGTWMEVRLSTTSMNPDGLSSTFADNVGSDETLVYAGTNWQFAASSGFMKFWMDASFTTPFFYDATKGNLLIEIRMPSYYNFSGYSLDAVTNTGDSVSRVYANTTNAVTGTADTRGVVTEFTFQDTVLSNITTVVSGSGLALEWLSISNAEYRVQSASTLTGDFVDVSTVITGTPPLNVNTQAPGGSIQFFRINRVK